MIIGGGKRCRLLLDLTRSSFLQELHLDVLAVADINPEAPGLKYAKQIGLQTFTNIKQALEYDNIEVIIELTGRDSVVQELYKSIKPGVKLIDHTIVRLFWDLDNAREQLSNQLLERRRLEENLEKERHFLQSIFDNLADLAIVLDRDYKITRVNAKFAKFAGIDPKQAIGKPCYEALKKTELRCDPDEYTEILDKVFESGKTFSFLRLTPPPDENHWEIVRSPIFNKEGKVEAVLGTWHRITERVMLHREIESQEQRFKSFIYSAQDWISIKDLDGRYVIVNPVTAKAFHKNPKDFTGKKPEEILDPNLASLIKKHDARVIETKKAITFDEIINIDGTDHHFHTIRFPLTDYKGEINGVCTIQRDTSYENRLQEQLIQSEKLAALGKLGAGVAHEINNPLTGIMAYAEDMAEEYDDDERIQEDLQVIIRETLRCRDIVRNLLDFARQDKPKLQKTQLNIVIKNSLELIERLPQFKDVLIEKELGKDLPLIESDTQQLQQVLLNLTLNAAEAMDFKGKIKLNTVYERRGNKCVISVEDNGPGIPENLVDKLFEPFFSTKGTNGLGLAVSWGIVERHGGTIEIDMAETGGAIFRIILPVK